MKLLEIALFEHVVNLHTTEDKEKYIDAVWDMLQAAYAGIGGFKSATSKEDLIQNTSIWKLVRRGGKLVSVGIYRDLHGRKSIAIATDGTMQGKKDIMKLKDDDLKLQRAWCECSGAAEALMKRAKAVPLDNKLAAKLTGKEIIGYDVDGVHYTRLIQGEPHVKVIYGFPQISDELKAELAKSNLFLNKAE